MAERAARSRRGTTSTRSRRASSAPAEGLDRDYSGEEYREPGEGYQGPTPAKGLYPAKLVQVRNWESSEGNASVRWTFELTGGESPNEYGEKESVAGFRDHQYTNDDTTLWREQQIAVALGLIKPNGRLKMSFDAIVKKAKPCTVRIIRERYIPEDGDPEWRAKIAAVLTARDTKSRRAKDEDAEDVFDGDEEDGDDEEEAPPPRRSRSRRKAEPEPEPEPEDEDEDEEDEEGDEGDWPEDPDELAAALEELKLTELKKVAQEDFGVTVKRGMKAPDIIDAILDTLEEADEDEDDEDEPEEEPEPPKRRARGGASSTRRKRGSSTEPPF